VLTTSAITCGNAGNIWEEGLGAMALNHDGTKLLFAKKSSGYLLYVTLTDDCSTDVGCNWNNLRGKLSPYLGLPDNGGIPYWSACTHSTTADVDYM
jgi:hypothetical protein